MSNAVTAMEVMMMMMMIMMMIMMMKVWLLACMMLVFFSLVEYTIILRRSVAYNRALEIVKRDANIVKNNGVSWGITT